MRSDDPDIVQPSFLYKGYRGVVHTRERVRDVPPLLETPIDYFARPPWIKPYPHWVYRGDVEGIRDTITFVGEGTAETITANTERAFRESVDCYVAWTKELGEEPEKPT